MAAQSKISHRQHFARYEQGLDESSASPTMPMASIALHSAADLPLADPFASGANSIIHEGHTGFHGDNYYGTDPSDGHTVWYCSNCGDGPMGTWITACTACGHYPCGACTVEKVS